MVQSFVIFCSALLVCVEAKAQSSTYQNPLNNNNSIQADFSKYGVQEFQVNNDSLQFLNSNSSFTVGAYELKKKLSLLLDFSISIDVRLNATNNYNLNPSGNPYGYLMTGFGFSLQSYSNSFSDYKNLTTVRLKRDNYYSGIYNFVSESMTYNDSRAENYNIGPKNQISDITLKAEYSATNKTIYFYWKSKSGVSFVPLCSRNLANEWGVNGSENLTFLVLALSDGVTSTLNDLTVKNLALSSNDQNLFPNNVSLILQSSHDFSSWNPLFTNNVSETNSKAFYRLQIQKQ